MAERESADQNGTSKSPSVRISQPMTISTKTATRAAKMGIMRAAPGHWRGFERRSPAA